LFFEEALTDLFEVDKRCKLRQLLDDLSNLLKLASFLKSPLGILSIWPWAMRELAVIEEMGRASTFDRDLVDEHVIRAEVGFG